MTYARDFYRLIRSKVDEFAVVPENVNEDGSINWNFVDADCYMEINPTEGCRELYYELWNEAVDNFMLDQAEERLQILKTDFLGMEA